MLSCAGADRLQTGMRGAFGKPYGLVAQVKIGHILMSVRTKDSAKANCIEAFRRAQHKYPGQQKLVVSRRHGFTPFTREEFIIKRESGEIAPDGSYIKILPKHGPISQIKGFPKYIPASA